jgi:hypothetical protein
MYIYNPHQPTNQPHLELGVGSVTENEKLPLVVIIVRTSVSCRLALSLASSRHFVYGLVFHGMGMQKGIPCF